MTSLAESFLRACALKFEPIPIVDLSFEEFHEREGIALENARLQPLHAAVSEVVAACEARYHGDGASSDYREGIESALTRLREVIGAQGGGRG